MSGAAMAMPPDPKQAFKAEWEALQICEHQWALKNVESDLLGINASQEQNAAVTQIEIQFK
ncbi:ER membrane protein complex subunit 3-like protein [Leptotrombidium deliense]|uniref:ER membrane protein complex subunit 3-like protein n=1 Tax=Leptotrombidium deliense TaxID=299467 RepID=A0A443S334_9ACAR|nr:ER membrane protein complex subunit 3-like protein [Leptotrombidium deliense]